MARPLAIVTGASRGIGRGIALALGKEGWAVIVNYAGNAAAAAETAAEIEKLGGKALPVQADISLNRDRERLVTTALEAFGSRGRIDLLVNNAGIAPAQRADILEATEESFDHLMNVNLKGPYFLTQSVAREMIRYQQNASTPLISERPYAPNIVTVSSISAYTASINRGDYCISKAGLGMMTALFAARLAPHGINVFEIRPGVIATDMTGPVKEKYDALIAGGLTPIARWGQPDDIARAVLAIALGYLPFSTGEVINVDGGFHMRRL